MARFNLLGLVYYFVFSCVVLDATSQDRLKEIEMIRYRYGYIPYVDKRSIIDSRGIERISEYADLTFNFIVISDDIHPIRYGDTVLSITWIANKHKPNDGWICPSFKIDPNYGYSAIFTLSNGARLAERIVNWCGIDYQDDVKRESYHDYIETLKLFDCQVRARKAIKEHRYLYGKDAGRSSSLDPWFMALVGLPLMKIPRLVRDQRLPYNKHLVEADKLLGSEYDKWMDWYNVYLEDDGRTFHASVTCLARNEEEALEIITEKYNEESPHKPYISDATWEKRRKAWQEANCAIISASKQAYRHSIPVRQTLDELFAIPAYEYSRRS